MKLQRNEHDANKNKHDRQDFMVYTGRGTHQRRGMGAYILGDSRYRLASAWRFEVYVSRNEGLFIVHHHRIGSPVQSLQVTITRGMKIVAF
jgi:hypothetical protein